MSHCTLLYHLRNTLNNQPSSLRASVFSWFSLCWKCWNFGKWCRRRNTLVHVQAIFLMPERLKTGFTENIATSKLPKAFDWLNVVQIPCSKIPGTPSMMLPNAYFTLGLVRLGLGVSSPKKDVRAQFRHLKADRSFSQHTVCNHMQIRNVLNIFQILGRLPPVVDPRMMKCLSCSKPLVRIHLMQRQLAGTKDMHDIPVRKVVVHKWETMRTGVAADSQLVL